MTAHSMRILLADDDALSREFLCEALESFGASVQACDDGVAALKAFERESFDAVFTDLKMPRKDGLQVVAEIQASDHPVPVVLVTAYGTVDVAVKALRAGADDVLMKPVDLEQIELVLTRLVERRKLLAENEYLRERGESPLIARSDSMREVDEMIDRVADSSVGILITGPSGTGKEVVASELHRRSSRARGPFVQVNCAAIPGTLLESEFFGHEAGAFTGATGRKIGKFELADGGTLLLDEIGEIALELQGKLLRVLEDGIVTRIGASSGSKVDVRIVAATNRDLKQMVDLGEFREDLYYRLNVLPIELRPLCERPEDLVALAELFVAEEGARMQRSFEVPEETLRLLSAYAWPGNIRELKNLLQRAALLTKGERITPELLRPWLGGALPKTPTESGATEGESTVSSAAASEKSRMR
jgi:two-component system response regulator AtoC